MLAFISFRYTEPLPKLIEKLIGIRSFSVSKKLFKYLSESPHAPTLASFDVRHSVGQLIVLSFALITT